MAGSTWTSSKTIGGSSSLVNWPAKQTKYTAIESLAFQKSKRRGKAGSMLKRQLKRPSRHQLTQTHRLSCRRTTESLSASTWISSIKTVPSVQSNTVQSHPSRAITQGDMVASIKSKRKDFRVEIPSHLKSVQSRSFHLRSTNKDTIVRLKTTQDIGTITCPSLTTNITQTSNTLSIRCTTNKP